MPCLVLPVPILKSMSMSMPIHACTREAASFETNSSVLVTATATVGVVVVAVVPKLTRHLAVGDGHVIEVRRGGGMVSMG